MTDLPNPEDLPPQHGGLIERTQRAVLKSVEEILHRQMGPFLEETRKAVLAAVEEVLQRHARPLLEALGSATRGTVEDLLQRQLGPFLDRSRQTLLEGLGHAGLIQKYTDGLVEGLKKLVAETITEGVKYHVPAYSRRLGRGLVRYLVAGVLLGLTAVFLVLGIVEGLQSAGLPLFVSFLIGGAGAGVAAFFLLNRRHSGESLSPPK